MDDRTFRNAMGSFATGVTVITTQVGEEIHGMTANAFMSISLNPKLVTISVDHRAKMLDKIKAAGKYAVNILSEDQVDISMHFAGQKQADHVYFDEMNGLPVIRDALTKIICDVYQSYEVGDHTLFIGEVKEIQLSEGKPLLFFGGKYAKYQSL